MSSPDLQDAIGDLRSAHNWTAATDEGLRDYIARRKQGMPDEIE